MGVFAAGAAVAALLEFMQRNHVMAGIVGCLTLVGVVFSWLWLRD
jgi:hypothetical protein